MKITNNTKRDVSTLSKTLKSFIPYAQKRLEYDKPFEIIFETDEEKLSFYQEVGTARVIKMVTKANEKNPDGEVINEENWAKLPTTLRYQISNKILGVEQEASENFTSG